MNGTPAKFNLTFEMGRLIISLSCTPKYDTVVWKSLSDAYNHSLILLRTPSPTGKLCGTMKPYSLLNLRFEFSKPNPGNRIGSASIFSYFSINPLTLLISLAANQLTCFEKGLYPIHGGKVYQLIAVPSFRGSMFLRTDC